MSVSIWNMAFKLFVFPLHRKRNGFVWVMWVSHIFCWHNSPSGKWDLINLISSSKPGIQLWNYDVLKICRTNFFGWMCSLAEKCIFSKVTKMGIPHYLPVGSSNSHSMWSYFLCRILSKRDFKYFSISIEIWVQIRKCYLVWEPMSLILKANNFSTNFEADNNNGLKFIWTTVTEIQIQM